MSNELFKESWETYLDFSEQVEELVYISIKTPSYYRNHEYFQFSEEYFTGNLLGVDDSDNESLLFYRDHWGNEESRNIGGVQVGVSRYQKIQQLKLHPVYKEFTVNFDDKWTQEIVDGFRVRLKKRLKEYQITEGSSLYEVSIIRYLGVISYYISKYLRRKEEVLLGVYNKNDHKKLKSSIAMLSGYLNKGISIPDNNQRADIIEMLTAIELMNSPVNNEELLNPDSYKYKKPEMVATIREFLLFCTFCGERRSPSFFKSIFYMIEPALTERIVEKACKDVKRYILERGVNKKKILVEELSDWREKIIPDQIIDDQYDIPSMHSNFYSELEITKEYEEMYENIV